MGLRKIFPLLSSLLLIQLLSVSVLADKDVRKTSESDLLESNVPYNEEVTQSNTKLLYNDTTGNVRLLTDERRGLSDWTVDRISQSFKSNNIKKRSADISGLWGTVEWEYSRETQTVTFTSRGWFVDVLSAPWRRYSEIAANLKKVIISQPVNADENMNGYFSELANLEKIDGLEKINTRYVTDMSQVFMMSPSLKTLDLNSWDTSKVTSMRQMFYNYREVDPALSEITIDKWNTSNVVDMSSMFYGLKSLTSLDVSKWNTSGARDMSYLFHYTFSLEKLDLSNWDTKRVSNMNNMFLDANALKELTLGKNFRFVSNSNGNPQLPDVPLNDDYTGKWRKKDGNVIGTSQEFMNSYDGSSTGTYVWEKTEPIPATVTINFITESGETLSNYQLSIATTVGETINLTTNQSVVNQLKQIEQDGYLISSVPENNTNLLVNQPTMTVNYTLKGTLMLLSAPQTIDFGTINYSGKVQRLTNPILSDSLTVRDTRGTGAQWKVTASMTKPLTTTSGIEIPNAFRYQYNGQEYILGKDATMISQQTNDTPIVSISDSWKDDSKNSGLVLQLNPSDMIELGEYSGVITWNLTASMP